MSIGTLPAGFYYQGDRPRSWQPSDDIWVHGYWAWDWANSYERVASLDLFDLVPASKEFTDLSRQPEGTFDCALVTYPLAAALLAAAVDTASLSKPKAICFGGWNFYRSKSLSGLLSPEDVDDKILTARKCGITEIYFSAPDRLFDSLKEVGNDVRRLDEEDSLAETIDPYRKVFQQA